MKALSVVQILLASFFLSVFIWLGLDTHRRYTAPKVGSVWVFTFGDGNPFKESQSYTNTVLAVSGNFVRFTNHTRGYEDSSSISLFKSCSIELK